MAYLEATERRVLGRNKQYFRR